MNLFPESWPLPQRRVFEGQFVTLAPVNAAADVAELFALTHEQPEFASMWQYLPYGPFASEDAMREWLREREISTDPLFFTVTNRQNAMRVGSLSIASIAPEHGRAEIGHVWYAPAVQRTKINTESVFLLLRHLFDELGYRRVEWKCHHLNEPSRRAALRLGFQFEGTFRQHMVLRGKNRDSLWFSMLDSEWPQRKANFERWLYEDDSVSLSQLNAELNA